MDEVRHGGVPRARFPVPDLPPDDVMWPGEERPPRAVADRGPSDYLVDVGGVVLGLVLAPGARVLRQPVDRWCRRHLGYEEQ